MRMAEHREPYDLEKVTYGSGSAWGWISPRNSPKSLSRSRERSTGCGAPSIRMASCLTSWSSAEETRRAAQRLMKKLLKSAVTPPRVMITDKLRSYGAARAKMSLRVEHRQHKGLKQSSGELPPTDAATRADHEALQINQTGATVSVGSRSSRQPLPRPLSRNSATADFRRASRERAFAAWREISKTGAF